MWHACHLPISVPSSRPSKQLEVWVAGQAKYPRIANRIKRPITTMLLITSTVSVLYTMLQFIYYTFFHSSFSHSCKSFVLTTCHLFKSWHEGAALPLLLHFLAAPGEGDDLLTTRIWMMISVQYPTVSLIVKMTIQNPMTSLFENYPGHQQASGH